MFLEDGPSYLLDAQWLLLCWMSMSIELVRDLKVPNQCVDEGSLSRALGPDDVDILESLWHCVCCGMW